MEELIQVGFFFFSLSDITITFLTLSLFESVDGDPDFVGADCPCMCSLYAGCENYGASASAFVEKAPGMWI